MASSRRRPTPAGPVLLLLVAWAILTVRLDAPWFGHYESNGAWISAAVRNYQLYGAGTLGLMPVINPGPATPDTFQYYGHHPPLIVWSVALASAVFGFHEAAARWVAISATLISIAAFYALACRLYDWRRAGWATAFYAFTPMMLYFGRMPNHEAPSLAVIMLLAVMLVDWLARPRRGRWRALAALGILAAWTSWAAVMFVGGFVLLGLWAGRGRQRRDVFLVGVITLLAVVALIGYYQRQWPGTLPDLLDTFLWRASDQSFRRGSEPFTISQFVLRQITHAAPAFTPSLVIVGLAGIAPAFRCDSRRAREMLAILLMAGLAYLLAFRNASYVHDYYKIYLAPSLAMAASAAFAYGWASQRRQRLVRPLLIGLVVMGGFSSATITGLFHASGDHYLLEKVEGVYYPLELAGAFAAQTTTGDLVWTDMPYLTPALAYYAFRDITYDMPPEEALSRAQEETGPVVYAYCGSEDQMPDSLGNFPHQTQAGCAFIRLR